MSPDRLKIGEWTVDPASGHVRSPDREASLPPLAMQLLVFLADHPNEVLSIDQMIDEVRKIADLVAAVDADRRPHFEAGLSTAFGCTIEGPVSEDLVVRSAERLMEAGVAEVGLSDTTGYANPEQVKRLVRKVQTAVGKENINGVHLHNTRGLGLANALAAIEEGITTIDSSLGGLGGCPFAPGASGNIVTEDLVFMLEAMGLHTGIDIDKLLDVRNILREALPDEPLYGFVPDAGVPLGFHQSDQP